MFVTVQIENPRIMLLDCPLEYKKGESQTNVEITKEEDWYGFQGIFGVVQGTFGVVQGIFVVVQGTSGIS
jgi:hypothetical protein